jgi:hypothetical protein
MHATHLQYLILQNNPSLTGSYSHPAAPSLRCEACLPINFPQNLSGFSIYKFRSLPSAFLSRHHLQFLAPSAPAMESCPYRIVFPPVKNGVGCNAKTSDVNAGSYVYTVAAFPCTVTIYNSSHLRQ